MGNNIKLQDLDISLEEERDIIEFIARKININVNRTINVNRLINCCRL